MASNEPPSRKIYLCQASELLISKRKGEMIMKFITLMDTVLQRSERVYIGNKER